MMLSFARSIFIIGILHLLVIVVAMASAVRQGLAIPLVCTDEGKAVPSNLKRLYNEGDIGGGQTNSSVAMRIYASPDGSTFTIVTYGTDGSACIWLDGTNLEILPPPRPAPVELEN